MMVSYKLTSDVIGKLTKPRKIEKRSTWQETEILTYNRYLLSESPEKQEISHSIIPYYLQVYICK